MEINPQNTALLITDPQNDFLSPEGATWGLVGESVTIGRLVLCGMSANLCVESHLRELLEQGFEVMVVRDATAAAITPDLGDGYAAAMTNFKFIANAVVTTEEAVEAMQQSGDAYEAVGAD